MAPADLLLEEEYPDCPEFTGDGRCGLPAEVLQYWVLPGSPGPVEGVKIRCVAGHVLNGPVDSLLIT